MGSILRIALVALGLTSTGLLPASGVAATLDPSRDARQLVRVDVWTDDDGPEGLIQEQEEIEVFDLFPFDERLELQRVAGALGASALAELETVITPTRVEARAFTDSIASALGSQYARGVGQALFRLEFTVAEPTPFDLTLVVLGVGEADVDVSLESLGEFDELELNGEPGEERLEISGVFQPGQYYNLYGFAFMRSDAGQGELPELGSAGFEIVLTVPEPGPIPLLGMGVLAGASLKRRSHPCTGRRASATARRLTARALPG